MTDQRTAIDFPHVIRDLVEVHYPQAERLVLVLDKLNSYQGLAVPDLPARRGEAAGGQAGMALHRRRRQWPLHGSDAQDWLLPAGRKRRRNAELQRPILPIYLRHVPGYAVLT